MFDLFDFNDIQSLSQMDFEYMICCCISSVSKIFSIKEEIPEEEIAKIISSNFAEDERVSITQVLKFATTNTNVKEIIQFFHFIGIDQLIKVMHTQEVLANAYNAESLEQSRKSISPFVYEPPSSVLHNKGFISFQKWLWTVYSPIAAKREPLLSKNKGKLSEVSANIDWIYGVNCNQQINSIEYYVSQNELYSYILYYCGCVVIIYDPVNCVQKYYNLHKVISLYRARFHLFQWQITRSWCVHRNQILLEECTYGN